MRKVPVIEAGDCEHAQHIQCAGDFERQPGNAHPENRHAGQVHGNKWSGAQPVNAIGIDLRVTFSP
jgi:hypothetical protein